jgi:hypothetical protein
MQVAMLEVGATYKFPVGPRIGPKNKAPATVLKEHWRAIAYGVKTKDRGNWLLRMVGPDDTVAAARSSFRSMVEALK